MYCFWYHYDTEIPIFELLLKNIASSNLGPGTFKPCPRQGFNVFKWYGSGKKTNINFWTLLFIIYYFCKYKFKKNG